MNRSYRRLKCGVPPIAGLVAASLTLGVFAGLARGVYLRQAFALDGAILNGLFRAESPALTRVMEVITTSAAVPFVALAVFALGLLWWRAARDDVVALIVALAGAVALNLIAKAIFERARPTLHPALVHALGYSFPSGHSQIALAFYGTVAYLLAGRIPPRGRIVLYGVAAVWISLVGLSRLYLEVHYPSDVLAAYAITLPWVLAVVFVHRCVTRRVTAEERVTTPARSS